MLAAVFFDMDGTLVDSEPLWEIATYELSERLGRRITPEIRRRTIGGSFENTLQLCAEHAGVSISAEQRESLRIEMYHRMGELFRNRLEPKDGVRELLIGLRNEGVPRYVTTNTERRLADASINAVGAELFTGSVAGDDVPHTKPAPDVYVRAAELAGADPHECLVFEDSTNGMLGAVAAGCRVVGLSHGEQEIPEGVVPMPELHGSCSFAGVGPALVREWFERCPVPGGAAEAGHVR